MTTAADRLTYSIGNIAALSKLKNDVDPASGMTVMVRRGPIYMEDEPPYIALEISMGMDAILDLLIQAEERNAQVRARFTLSDKERCEKALELYDKRQVKQ